MDAASDRPRWALTVVCALGSWVIAAAVAVMALLAGSGFAAGRATDSSGSVVLWFLSGVFVALPITVLPALGLGLRRRTAWTVAVAVVIAVTLTGVVGLNTP